MQQQTRRASYPPTVTTTARVRHYGHPLPQAQLLTDDEIAGWTTLTPAQ